MKKIAGVGTKLVERRAAELLDGAQRMVSAVEGAVTWKRQRATSASNLAAAVPLPQPCNALTPEATYLAPAPASCFWSSACVSI
jgi:hypothetical protein